MPASTAPVAGADITATGVGNIRKDAIVRTVTAVAGAAFNQYTTTGSVTFLTLLYLSGQKWYPFIADGTVSLGSVQALGLAGSDAAGDGSTFTLVLENSTITQEFFPSITGIAQGALFFGSATVLGGVATYDGATMKSYRLLGNAPQANVFNFAPNHNTSAIQNTFGLLTAAGTITRFDICYLNTSGQVQRTDSSTPFGAGYADAFMVANSSATVGQPIMFYKIGSICAVNPGGFTAGQPVFTSDTPGAGSHTRGRFSRQIGVAVDANNVYLCPVEPNRNMIIEVIVADEAWSTGDFLYRKSSNGRAAKSDADLVEPGIAECPYIALSTHASVGSLQPVALPGSILHSIISGTAGTQLWNSTTAGARSTTFPGQDLYTRKYGYFIDIDRFFFSPEPLRFLPPGQQEKGFASVGHSRAIGFNQSCVNFNKVMVNTPSSITWTPVAQQNVTAGPDAGNGAITRWGMPIAISNNVTSGTAGWSGYYETVGN